MNFSALSFLHEEPQDCIPFIHTNDPQIIRTTADVLETAPENQAAPSPYLAVPNGMRPVH
jgi:hypothetical protein